MKFLVNGKASAEATWFCECEDCEGHEASFWSDLCVLVDAESPEDAAQQAMDGWIGAYHYDECLTDWQELDVSSAQDVLMRYSGAPMLPGFERIQD